MINKGDQIMMEKHIAKIAEDVLNKYVFELYEFTITKNYKSLGKLYKELRKKTFGETNLTLINSFKSETIINSIVDIEFKIEFKREDYSSVSYREIAKLKVNDIKINLSEVWETLGNDKH